MAGAESTADPAFDYEFDLTKERKRHCKVVIIPRFDTKIAGKIHEYCRQLAARLRPTWECVIAAGTRHDYDELLRAGRVAADQIVPAMRLEEFAAMAHDAACIISTRMHGCILSTVAHVRAIPVFTGDPKLKSIAALLQSPCVDLAKLSVDEAVELTVSALEKGPDQHASFLLASIRKKNQPLDDSLRRLLQGSVESAEAAPA